MNYSPEELNEAYKKLSRELKDVLFSVNTANAVNSIGQKYSLHIDQIGELNSEAGLVLLGLTHPTEFVSSLTKGLGVDRIIASQIASEVNDQVFLRVRELLKNVHKDVDKVASDIEEPARPSKDALLAAIEHPEGMLKRPSPAQAEIPLVAVKNPYAPAKPEMGKDFPIVAPIPVRTPSEVFGDTTSSGRSDIQKPPAPTEASGDILTQKMSGQFSLPKVETKISVNATTTKRIDPYKEQV